MKTKSKVKVKSKRDETVIEGQWRATARYVNNLELDRRPAADEMPHVTPDTVVKCPECGATFRVGKALV